MDTITANTYCIHCDTQTYWDKYDNQRNHVWSMSPWCNQNRPTANDTVAERIER